ncbi:MAG: GDP-L-fucose synthase [Chloroflexi bacterium]|nr:GDP-L-fucose synthase [Chloroflexota bacterium]
MSDLVGKRVAVTGGAGFLGNHVVERLRGRGCRDVFVPRSAEYDLRDGNAVARVYEKARPQVVLHLAARVGGIGYNKERPAETLVDNLLMGLQVMEQGRRFGVEKLVAVSSVCAYPKYAPLPFQEGDLWEGYPEETNGPYGVAKRVLALQARVYRQQYGFNAVALLLSNLYGPGDNFDPSSSHVIPALIRRCLEAADEGRESVEVWGSGSASREFLYVGDAAEAVVLAAESYEGREPINIGSGEEVTVRQLAETIARFTGFRGRIEWDASKPDGQPRRSIDTTRAQFELGFKTKTPLEEGLRKTIEWYLGQRETVAAQVEGRSG